MAFPYFFVGTFIEASTTENTTTTEATFPYFFVGTFIEARMNHPRVVIKTGISLLFRRDFH